MKKKIMAILGAAAVACVGAALIAGCSDGGNNNNNNNDDKDTFTITVESGTGYTAKADKQKAEFGDTVTITVEVTDPDMYIEGVFANSNELDENSDGKYTATVTTNLTIKVEMGEYKEVLSDGGLTFASGNPTTITKNDGNTKIWTDDNQLIDVWELNVNLSWGQTAALSSRSEITSSNQAVIPNSAISFKEGDKGNSAWIHDAQVYIDSSKISEGSTWLTIYFKSNNTSSDGTLCVKITVTDEPVAPETMSVVFTFKNTTDYPDEDIFFNVTDITTGDIKTIWLSDFTDGKYTFEYAVGHTYRVTCAYTTLGEDGAYDNMTNLYLLEWQGTNLGGAVNTLEQEGTAARYTLELTTAGIEVPFTIQER